MINVLLINLTSRVTVIRQQRGPSRTSEAELMHFLAEKTVLMAFPVQLAISTANDVSCLTLFTLQLCTCSGVKAQPVNR